MTLTQLSAVERKRQLVVQENLERATGKGEALYVPGERWKNNKMYLVDDSVTDGNGNPYIALEDSRNKTPANSPEYWKSGKVNADVKRWSDISVGTEIQIGTEVIHNSKNWICGETHIKTAGNGPKQGSTIWISKS